MQQSGAASVAPRSRRLYRQRAQPGNCICATFHACRYEEGAPRAPSFRSYALCALSFAHASRIVVRACFAYHCSHASHHRCSYALCIASLPHFDADNHGQPLRKTELLLANPHPSSFDADINLRFEIVVFLVFFLAIRKVRAGNVGTAFALEVTHSHMDALVWRAVQILLFELFGQRIE